MAHEALLALFQHRPSLAAELLRDALGVPVPAFAEARLLPGDLTEVVPRERRADAVVLLVDEQGEPQLGIVVEAQLSHDPKKAYTWPAYLVGVRSRYECPASVLVVAPDPAVADKISAPIQLGPCGSTIQPLVLGPSAVPVITEPATERLTPELAMLSVFAHGQREDVGLKVALAALALLAGLEPERATLYEEVVLSCLSEAMRRELEEKMASGAYEYKSELIRKNIEVGRAQGLAEGLAEGRAEGRAEGEAKGRAEGEAKGRAEGEAKGKGDAVLAVLEARGISIPDKVRARVASCSDLATLERWVRRAGVVGGAGEIFDEPT